MMQVIECKPIRIMFVIDENWKKNEIRKELTPKYKSIILYDDYLSIDNKKYKIIKTDEDRAYKIMKTSIKTNNNNSLKRSIEQSRDANSPRRFESLIDKIVEKVKPMK